MGWVTPSNKATGDVLTSSGWNQDVVGNTIALPRGILFTSGTLTSAFTTTGTHSSYQTRTGMSGSVTYGASRYLRVVAVMRPYASGGANSIRVQFRRGTTVLAQNFINSVSVSTSGINSIVLEWMFAGPVSGATETFDVQISGNANTAVDDSAGATYPSLFYVEDLGSQ